MCDVFNYLILVSLFLSTFKMKLHLIKNILQRLVCFILLLQIFAIAIDLPGVIDLKRHNISQISDVELPMDEKASIEKGSDNLELYFSSSSANDLVVLAIFLQHNSLYKGYTSIPPGDPNFPPPKAA
jgi:hypothetical protein